MADRAVVVAKKGKGHNLDAVVILKEDLEGRFSSVLPALFRFALSPVASLSKGKSMETAAFSSEDLKRRFIPEIQERFDEAVRSGLSHRNLPPDVLWVTVKGQPLLFLAQNVFPAAPSRTVPAESGDAQTPPGSHPGLTSAERINRPRDFERAFFAAFNQLDRRNGSTNFVKLADLRRLLPEFDRDEFDSGLRRLRADGHFSLDSDEGVHGSLTQQERESGVQEAGSILVYASRT
jgi:hypothetical protein